VEIVEDDDTFIKVRRSTIGSDAPQVLSQQSNHFDRSAVSRASSHYQLQAGEGDVLSARLYGQLTKSGILSSTNNLFNRTSDDRQREYEPPPSSSIPPAPTFRMPTPDTYGEGKDVVSQNPPPPLNPPPALSGYDSIPAVPNLPPLPDSLPPNKDYDENPLPPPISSYPVNKDSHLEARESKTPELPPPPPGIPPPAGDLIPPPPPLFSKQRSTSPTPWWFSTPSATYRFWDGIFWHGKSDSSSSPIDYEPRWISSSSSTCYWSPTSFRLKQYKPSST